METDYPWDGRVRVVIDASPDSEWGLTVRVPHWAAGAPVQVNGQRVDDQPVDGWMTVRRRWTAGDELVLDLPLDVRLSRSDPRVDVNRGAVALERGPLVYCLEAVDNPGHRLDDVVIDTRHVPEVETVSVLGGVATLRAQAALRSRTDTSWWPYADAVSSTAAGPDLTPLTAVPYFAWGNREEGAMRVWIPAD